MQLSFSFDTQFVFLNVLDGINIICMSRFLLVELFQLFEVGHILLELRLQEFHGIRSV